MPMRAMSTTPILFCPRQQCRSKRRSECADRLKGLFTQSGRYKVNFVSCDTFRRRATQKAQIDQSYSLSYDTICRIV
jgi:hypothetical protein